MGSTVGGQYNVTRSPRFDTHIVAGAAAFFGAAGFVTLFNQGVGTKGLAVTNIGEPHRIGNQQPFLVRSIRASVLGASDIADVRNLQSNVTLELYVSGKLQVDGPLEYFNGGMGINAFAMADASAAPTSVSNYALGAAETPVMFDIDSHPAFGTVDTGVLIEQNDTFEVILRGTPFNASAAGIKLRIYLDGLIGRLLG